MLKHLSKKNLRLINHLTLLNENRQQCTVSQLATFSACSERTVYSDIDLIDYFYGELLDLDIVNGLVMMKNTGSGSLNRVINDIIINDLNFELLLNFYTEANEPVEHYAVKNAVSVQSIHNARKTINEALSQYKIKVVSHNGVYSLKAESDYFLQLFMAHFLFFAHFKADEEFYRLWLRFKTEEDLSRITNDFFTIEKDVKMIFMSAYIFFKNEYDTPRYEQIVGNFHAIINYLIEQEKILMPYVDDFISLFYPLAQEHKFVYDLETIERFKEMLLFAFSINYLLRSNTYTSQYRIRNFINTFKVENINFYNQTLSLINQIDLPQAINPVAVVDTIIYLSYLNFKNIINYKQCKILVISDLSPQHAETLVQRFKKHFPMHHFSPSFVHPKDKENPLHYKDYAYIIATAKLKQFPKEKIVYVKDFPDSEDFKNLYELLYY